MIKIKMINLINVNIILNKICSYDNEDMDICFKYKVGMMSENLTTYIRQYSKQMLELTEKYKITINNDQYFNENIDILNKFIEEKNKLENLELEVEQKKIKYDKNFNNISGRELMIISPFFDFSDLR